MDLGDFVYPRGNTLMGMAAAQFGQAQTVRFDQPRAGFGGAIDKLPHAGIAAARLDITLDDGLRCGATTKRKSPAWPGFLTNVYFDQFYFASFAI